MEDDSTSVSYTSYGPGESYILIGLHPGSQYRVGLAAYTVEIGPTSFNTGFVTTEDSKQGVGALKGVNECLHI